MTGIKMSINRHGEVSGEQAGLSLAELASDRCSLEQSQILAGHYQIISLLGSGGMSEVYQARHQLLDKLVAIKILRPSLNIHPGSIRRFQQEAQAVSSLDNQHLIKVYELAVLGDSRPFMVMEYVDGMTLAQHLRIQGQLTLDEALELFLQVCDGLAHAHENGVLHRDLKPSNIMLRADTKKIKILDFGIANLIGKETQTLTGSGEIFGSPPYMSPEQGSGKRVDARSDVYSLGCVFFEALTG